MPNRTTLATAAHALRPPSHYAKPTVIGQPEIGLGLGSDLDRARSASRSVCHLNRNPRGADRLGVFGVGDSGAELVAVADGGYEN